jgi:hypothetical protein
MPISRYVVHVTRFVPSSAGTSGGSGRDFAMSACDYSDTCPYYNELLPHMTDVEKTKAHYCLSSPSECARYRAVKIFRSRRVPDDLFPGDHDRLCRMLTQRSRVSAA